MVSFKLSTTLLLLATFLITSGVFGHEETFEQKVRRELNEIHSREALEKCKHHLIGDEKLYARHLAKREEFVSSYVKERGIQRRNKLSYMKRDEIGPRALFEAIECILAPETTIGPYYIESTIRKDVREGQKGIEMLLDIQFVDVNTCRPVPDLYVDIWQANATGIYGGVSAENTVGQTQLRGLQKTDSDGVLEMITIFPGWYQGRAVHTHILAHKGGRVDSTGRYHSGGTVPHIGQLFWDQNLISQVRGLAPYNTNSMQLLPNNQDFIFMQQNRGYNAIMKTELLGNTLAEGILATISIGINLNYHNPDIGAPGLPNPTAK